MKKIVYFLSLISLALSCARTQSLRNGDLIFVGIPADYRVEDGSMDDAIIASTASSDSLNLIHVAIAEVRADSVWIIDATIKHGVDRHPLDTFLTDFTLRDGSLPEFLVKKVPGVDADAAVERAKSYCGRAYDTRFLPDNEELYCSELVQLSYLDSEGRQVFKSEPMNWLAPDGSMPEYWTWLFGKLGMDVPQGVPGTNPRRMFDSLMGPHSQMTEAVQDGRAKAGATALRK